jgi:hypothetical protein
VTLAEAVKSGQPFKRPPEVGGVWENLDASDAIEVSLGATHELVHTILVRDATQKGGEWRTPVADYSPTVADIIADDWYVVVP